MWVFPNEQKMTPEVQHLWERLYLHFEDDLLNGEILEETDFGEVQQFFQLTSCERRFLFARVYQLLFGNGKHDVERCAYTEMVAVAPFKILESYVNDFLWEYIPYVLKAHQSITDIEDIEMGGFMDSYPLLRKPGILKMAQNLNNVNGDELYRVQMLLEPHSSDIETHLLSCLEDIVSYIFHDADWEVGWDFSKHELAQSSISYDYYDKTFDDVDNQLHVYDTKFFSDVKKGPQGPHGNVKLSELIRHKEAAKIQQNCKRWLLSLKLASGGMP